MKGICSIATLFALFLSTEVRSAPGAPALGGRVLSPALATNRLRDLVEAIPVGSTTHTVDTIEALLKLSEASGETYFVVRAYARAQDHGGGVFRYDMKSAEPPDGGTVFAPKSLPGRFKRVFDPEGHVYAEWFGACGDAGAATPHDDSPAINACLRKFRRVRLLRKTYGVRGTPTHYNPNATYHAIDLGPNYRIEGEDRDTTRIRLLDGTNPKGSSPGNNYFSVIANRRFHESADHVIVRDLTIDCNFDGQNKHTTIHAISIRGGAALVERVSFRGYGTGCHPKTGSSRECFVIHQSLVYKAPNTSRQGAIYRYLDFTHPGHNGDVKGHVAEITHITLGGANNFGNYSWIVPKGRDPDFDPSNNGENENNWWPSYGGLVENCTIHDERYDPSVQKSPLHGITYGNCVGLVIRHNRVTDFEGSAVYVMSWWNKGTVIVDNEFIGVSNGLALQIKGIDGKPLQAPRHEGVRFERNSIVLAAPPHHKWSPSGVQLYGQSLGPGIRLRDIVVRNNRIRGRQYVDAAGRDRFPVGVQFQVLHANYSNIIFEDNWIDVPDFPDAVYVPQEPYSMSIVYFPMARWKEDQAAGNTRFVNNRNSNGQLLYPILVDWYYKNKPTLGKPSAQP